MRTTLTIDDALAMEQGYHTYSTDSDFHRFPGVRHDNPLAQP